MAERTTRRSPRAKPTDKEKLNEAAAPSPETNLDLSKTPAVVVWRDGPEIRVAVVGGLDPLSAPSLLKYGVVKVEQELGIG